MRKALLPIVLAGAVLTLRAQAPAPKPQPPEPTPAFAGQTDAPPPTQRSPALAVRVVADGLTGAWAVAFLPDGRYLVTQSAGQMRIVSADGKVSAPIAGVPGVKTVAAQGLHDVLLDPQFATNRLIYFTYFAPPKGQEPRNWPIEHFYEEVWTKPLAERRTMQLGYERVARARLSDDGTRLENLDILAEGAERRIVLARDGTLFITGADRFRFYDSDLDGVNHDFTDNPDVRRNFTGRILRINRDGSIPKDNPWLSRATVAAETFAHGLKDPEGGAIHPQTGELWVIDHGPQGGDEINIVRGGKDYGWPDVSYGRAVRRAPAGRTQERAGWQWPAVDVRSGGTSLLLGAVDRSVGDDVLYRDDVPGVAGQSVRRRDGRSGAGAPGAQGRACDWRGAAADRSQAAHP